MTDAIAQERQELPWPYERCKSERCQALVEPCKRYEPGTGLRITVGFSVSDADWRAVRGDDHRCRCLTCFDEEAQAKGVRYRLLDVHPVTWHGETVKGNDDAT